MANPLPALQQRIHQLLSTASVSSVSPQWDMGNRPVIDLLANWFTELGFTCHIQDLGNHKANLIACKGSGPGGLVLSGHSDTVPFDEQLWSSDPLSATEKDDKIYGLGSADMKSFFALIIEAVMPLLLFVLFLQRGVAFLLYVCCFCFATPSSRQQLSSGIFTSLFFSMASMN